MMYINAAGHFRLIRGACPKSLWKNYDINILPPSLPPLNVTAFQARFNAVTKISNVQGTYLLLKALYQHIVAKNRNRDV